MRTSASTCPSVPLNAIAQAIPASTSSAAKPNANRREWVVMRSTHADTHPLTYKAHAVLKPLPVHIPDLLYVCDVKPGRLIRERRLANGLTQAQIALRAGSTQESISRLE